jgi:GTP-binding protein YchF
MGIQIGIIGLPNVGKSTMFNALTKTQQAKVANYPFCTIEPNRAIVPVPDTRVDRLADLVDVDRRIFATIEFVDIAGLVKGASKGEGLGNQFLGNIRDTDALLHVVRCFEDENVAHTSAMIDPEVDIAVIATELMLADIQQLDKKIDRLTRQAKGDRKYKDHLKMASALVRHLDSGSPISTFSERSSDVFRLLEREMRFLTSKPVIYAANVDEVGLETDDEYVETVRHIASNLNSPVVKVSAQLEQELAGLSDSDRQEYLDLAGLADSALDQVIRTGYEILGLISFFTHNAEEVRAWTVPEGSPAARAAGEIHTDFERGFIRAEVIPFEIYDQYGSLSAVKAAGAMQLEGKDYQVQDGDVIYIRFNV